MNILLVVVIFAATGNAQGQPIVETAYGIIRGAIDVTEDGEVYERYFGVPFAEPPVEELRFAKPIPREPWQDVLDTTSFGKQCIDFNNSTDTSEDCLYLNIYVPGQNRSGDGLAILLFVHGGGYSSGSASNYPSQDLAVHGDLIVVTTNYRLGAFGFLSTEDEAAPGNYGLWDVKLALEWVRDNIAAFGGSPDRVTVFGQSAGGAITSHVMISPETQGLFQRGICISGSSSNLAFGTSVSGSVAITTNILGQILGCADVNNSNALVQCLREQDPYDIIYYGGRIPILTNVTAGFYFPVVDGEFIPQDPALSWNQTTPFDIDLITGAVIQDAAFYVLSQRWDNPNVTTNWAETHESTDLLLRMTFKQFPGNYEDIKAAVINQYPGANDSDKDTRTQTVTQLLTDFNFAYGQHFEASHHSSVTAATYMYEYAYPISFMRPYIPEEYSWLIAEHSEDLWSIFGEQLVKDYVENVLDGEFSEEDKQMSSRVMSYFSNFANTGNPNEGLEVPVFWPQYTREFREFLQFSEDTEVLVETEEELNNFSFWVQEFPPLAVPDRHMYTTMDMTYDQLQRVYDENFAKVSIQDKMRRSFSGT